MGWDGGMGYGSGIAWITLILIWAVLGLGIAALWKYINKK